MTKEKWVKVFEATGLSEDDMNRWHVKFEELEPDGHQEFLEFIQIPADDIAKIRERSRTHGSPG
jgi:hypothetical protein